MPDGVLTPGVIQRWQQSSAASGVGPTTLDLATPSLSGSVLVLVVAVNSTSSLVLPNGWTTAGTMGSSGACFAVLAFLPDAPAGTTSVSYTMSGGAPNASLLVELANASTTAPLDTVGQTASAAPMTAQTVSTATATTTAPEVAVAVFCEDVNTPTYTPDPAWTRLGTVSATSATPSLEADFTIATTPGVVTETVTSSVSGKYSAVIAAFK